MSYNLELWTDISGYQNLDPPRPIDFVKMKAAGVNGVCIRKSIGYFQDKAFQMNWKGAGDAGLKRTVYVVPFVGYDDARQLAAMILNLDPTKLDRPAWLDIERAHTKGKQAGANMIIWFLNQLTVWSGVRPDIYTAKYAFETYYSSEPGWIDDTRLVVANYGAGIPAIPKGWRVTGAGVAVPAMEAWTGWQYSADGNGLGRALGAHTFAIDLSWQKV